MRAESLRDRDEIERFLRRDAPANVYGLADLDDAFWPDTRWFCLRSGGAIGALCLLFEKLELPILYAIAPRDHEPTRALLEQLAPTLPERCFATLGPGLHRSLEPRYEVESRTEFVKMVLDPTQVLAAPGSLGTESLGREHFAELREFYARDAYLPEESDRRFFEPYMLEIGPWFAIREAGRIASVAGVHVASERMGVAALGGIATRPDRRGRGLARAVTASVCAQLRARVPIVGLNVAVENRAAIRCYAALGFREVCRYEEMELTRRD